MDNLHFLPNIILTILFKELKKNFKNDYCRVTNRSPNSDRIGYGPNKPNTINL